MGHSRSQVNKQHKRKFSPKSSSRTLHRTSLQDSMGIGKRKSNNFKGAKNARRQRHKMARDQKRAAVLKEKRASGGSTSAPRLIVLFPLSASVELNSLGEDIIKVLSTDGSGMASSTVASSEYKLRVKVLKAPHGDLLTCMEMAKVADLLAFVASASSPWEENISNYIDSFGSQCLSVFKSIGLPSTAVLIRGLPSESEKKNELKKMCTSQLESKFPKKLNFYADAADTTDELHNFMRLFKAQTLTVPGWRSQRSYLVADKAGMLVDDESLGKCTLLLSGYLRARKLSINQLVHVSGVGDFQLSKIEVLKDPFPLIERRKQNTMELDDAHDAEVLRSLHPDPMEQEQLVVENTPYPLAGEQTWPTEEEMAEADRNQKQGKLKKRTLPRGTSDYQAAWIVDETDGEGSDSGDSDDNGMELDRGEGRFDQKFEDEVESLNLEDIDNETQNNSEMIEGENLTREQIEDEIKKIKEAHAEDQEFPDEVETPIDVPARKRFAKYRGLKSLRTSTWDPNESLPQDYARIFAFANVARTRKLVLKQALKMEEESRDDCVSTGSYVRLHIKEVPLGAASKLSSLVNTKPVIASGLLQHESKISVLNFIVTKYNGYEAPIKTKEEFMFHVGFRQFIARPVFAADSSRPDKDKMERFLHPGGSALASVYGPISFPPLPLVVVKMMSEGLLDGAPAVAALGYLKSIDPNKIILKKIVLTGYPKRVSKMKASVRYMFHNPEDVRWFKPVEVHTKLGKRGRVKEPLGTHGAMKCVFNGVVQQNDVVCMDLWKRAYPKWPDHMYPQQLL
ncbi:hypothetical protein OROHE_001275 [Orobanche hederae]